MTKRCNKVPMYIHVLMYFTANPDEELTAEDIKAKFPVYDRGYKSVSNSLYNMIQLGWVSQRGEYSRQIRGRLTYYSAGPLLLQQLGHIRAMKETAQGEEQHDTASQ